MSFLTVLFRVPLAAGLLSGLAPDLTQKYAVSAARKEARTDHARYKHAVLAWDETRDCATAFFIAAGELAHHAGTCQKVHLLDEIQEQLYPAELAYLLEYRDQIAASDYDTPYQFALSALEVATHKAQEYRRTTSRRSSSKLSSLQLAKA